MLRRDKEIKQIRFYSEALKRQVVAEFEKGRATAPELMADYDIHSKSSIYNWRSKYGKIKRETKVVRVIMKSEREKIRELEKAVADLTLKNIAHEALIEVYEADSELKKAKYAAIEKIRGSQSKASGYGVRELCEVFGVTRDAYYKAIGREGRRSSRESLIVELVKSIRHYLPRLGCKKLKVKLDEELRAHGFEVPGRDQLFGILRKHGLLLERRKSRNPCTTYSGHNYAVQPNLMRNLVLTKPLQALVSDVTYLRVGDGFAYLFLTTDAFSRKIVGFHLARTLEHVGAIVALKIAVKGIEDATGIIFHSDRGVQYCCHDFLSALSSYKMRSSMTDADHCAQNALAERMNGILKNEFYLDEDFLNFEMASKAVQQAILMYNQERPHRSLKMKTPNYFHLEALAA